MENVEKLCQKHICECRMYCLDCDKPLSSAPCNRREEIEINYPDHDKNTFKWYTSSEVPPPTNTLILVGSFSDEIMPAIKTADLRIKTERVSPNLIKHIKEDIIVNWEFPDDVDAHFIINPTYWSYIPKLPDKEE